jgi:hypothetical protein
MALALVYLASMSLHGADGRLLTGRIRGAIFNSRVGLMLLAAPAVTFGGRVSIDGHFLMAFFCESCR